MFIFLADSLPAPLSTANEILINDVRDFYETSWSHLVYTVGMLFIVIGLIFPILIQYWQRRAVQRNAENEERRLRGIIEEKISSMTMTIEENKKTVELALQQHVAKLAEDLRINQEKLLESTKKEMKRILASSLHSSATISYQQKLFSTALPDIISGADAYMAVEDEGNLAALLNMLLDSINAVNKDQIQDLDRRGWSVDEFLERLTKYNVRGAFNHQIYVAGRALSEAKKREPAK